MIQNVCSYKQYRGYVIFRRVIYEFQEESIQYILSVVLGCIFNPIVLAAVNSHQIIESFHEILSF